MASYREGSSSETQPTLEDFLNSGWEEAFQENAEQRLASVADSLASKAQKAFDEEKLSQSKALYLLADACSMMLYPESLSEPFKPYISYQNYRSPIPDDFGDQDLDYFSEILLSIEQPQVLARLSDLIWFKRRDNIQLALQAIDSYMKTPISLESFSDWFRALQLACQIKDLAADKVQVIERQLLNKIDETSTSDFFLAKRLADLLRKFNLGSGHEVKIAEKLLSLANAFKTEKNLDLARNYYNVASYWFSKADKELESYKSIACQGEAWRTEAQLKEDAKDFIGAADALEKSIQVYRTIPNKYRTSVGMEENLLEKLQSDLSRLGKLASESMTQISSYPIDITNFVSASRQSIHGKQIHEALKILANLYPGAKKAKIRTEAEKVFDQFSLKSLFRFTCRTKDGRKVEEIPSTASAPKGSPKYELKIENEMLQTYYREISIVALGIVIPALELIIAEHPIQLSDFEAICTQSSIVPPGRERAFAKALLAGFELDFDLVIHRIVPQIENMIRYHLKAIGTVTTILSKDGIETEKNLSTLLKTPEASQIFGEDLIFEIEALFCKNSGPNFRHNLAHGLLEDRDFETTFAVYAWCLTLRIVFNVFWNSQRDN